jgi:hypothetical protein
MIPSKAWFPSSLQDRTGWFQNFATNFAAVGASLGFTGAEITAVTQDNEDFQSIAATTVALEAFSTAVRQYRISLTEDPIGTPQPTFPTEDFSAPPNDRPAGMFQRLVELVDRIRAAPAYTDEIGANLGIIPQKDDELAENELKPSLKGSAMPNNKVEVVFVRGKTDGIEVEIVIDNTGGWVSAGRFFKSPAVLNIPDGNGLPRAVQIRARYVLGNEAVGLNSDTVNVVTTP